jgi:hypothetical protein
VKSGVWAASSLHYQNLLRYKNLSQAVDACTGSESWWSELAAIFADCVDLAALIDKVSFKYCPREANEAMR